MLEAKSHIIIIGFMGTGKSSVSRYLSEQLQWNRLDLDEEIERQQARKISEIFKSSGEEAFRKIENAVLKQLLSGTEPSVIATGGGAVLRADNRELMLRSGWVVALKADESTIVERVSSDTARPLLQGDAAERVRALLAQRESAYDFAHFTIDTSPYTAEQVASRIWKAWKENVKGEDGYGYESNSHP